MKHNNIIAMVAISLTVATLMGACKQSSSSSNEPIASAQIYQFAVADGQGDSLNLSQYEGQVLLIVNTATECGFTPQYTELQSIYSRFHGRGLEILDFPCNQFGAQAPGSNAEIAAFCTGTYGTTFAQLAKVDVNGDDAAPLFVYLKEQAPFGGFDTTDPRGAYLDKMFRAQDSLYDSNSDIKWNFTKFLVDRNGTVVARFEPTAPMSAVESAIQEIL